MGGLAALMPSTAELQILPCALSSGRLHSTAAQYRWRHKPAPGLKAFTLRIKRRSSSGALCMFFAALAEAPAAKSWLPWPRPVRVVLGPAGAPPGSRPWAVVLLRRTRAAQLAPCRARRRPQGPTAVAPQGWLGARRGGASNGAVQVVGLASSPFQFPGEHVRAWSGLACHLFSQSAVVGGLRQRRPLNLNAWS